MGHCEHRNCAPLRKFLDASVCGHCDGDVVLEFSDCQSIDSTALGLIAKAALILRKAPGRKLIMANLRKQPRHAVIQLGLKHLTHLEDTPEYEYRRTRINHPATPNRDDGVDHKTILEAHTALVEVSPNNRKLFADVVALIGDTRDTGPDLFHPAK